MFLCENIADSREGGDATATYGGTRTQIRRDETRWQK